MTFMALLVRSCTAPASNSDALHLLDSLISVGWALFKLWPHCSPPLPVPIKCHASCRNHWCIQTSCIQETGLDIHPPYWNPLMLSRVVLLGEKLNGHDCKKPNTTQRERQPKRLWASACGTCISAALSNHCSTLTQSRTRSCGNFLQWEINKAHREKEIPFFDPLPSSCLRQSDAPPLPWRQLARATSLELHGRPAHLHLFPVPGIVVNQLKH